MEIVLILTVITIFYQWVELDLNLKEINLEINQKGNLERKGNLELNLERKGNLELNLEERNLELNLEERNLELNLERKNNLKKYYF